MGLGIDPLNDMIGHRPGHLHGRLSESEDLAAEVPEVRRSNVESGDREHFIGTDEDREFAVRAKRKDAAAVRAVFFAVVVHQDGVPARHHEERVIKFAGRHQKPGGKAGLRADRRRGEKAADHELRFATPERRARKSVRRIEMRASAPRRRPRQ